MMENDNPENMVRRTIIITGGNTGLGFECAKILSKADKSNFIVLACRNPERARTAVASLKSKTANDHIAAMDLDLSSLESVRNFVTLFKSSGFPPLYAVVCNAGIQIVNGTKYTKDGFEATFGVNHLGHYLMVNLLLDQIADTGRIIFVSSDTHDPLQKTGMPEPVYEKAEYLAFPDRSNRKLIGKERYTTSKLCNIYCTYSLAEKIRSQTNKNINANAFNPGMMPGTSLARDYSLLLRFAWKYILPVLTLFKRNVNTVRKSGKALASLVTNTDLDNVTGKYFNGVRQICSSPLSYNVDNRDDLWKTSIELVQLKENESILPLE